MSGPQTAPLLIRGGRVVDPSQGIDGPADVLLEEGLVVAVEAVVVEAAVQA